MARRKAASFQDWFKAFGNMLLRGWLRAKEDGNEESFADWVLGEYDHYCCPREVYEVPYCNNAPSIVEKVLEKLGMVVELEKVDWRQLRMEKVALLTVIDGLPEGWSDEVDYGKDVEDWDGDDYVGCAILDGLVHFLDYVQDEAAKVLGEKVVFGELNTVAVATTSDGVTGQWIDDICECGHLRSKHGKRYADGHGNCSECACPQFTWKDFVVGESDSKTVVTKELSTKCPRCGSDKLELKQRVSEYCSMQIVGDSVAMKDVSETYDCEFQHIYCAGCNNYWYSELEFVKEVQGVK